MSLTAPADPATDDFASIVRRYSAPVFASALRQLRDHQLAEDTTQAVFLALHQSRHTLESPAHLAGWLFQSTRYVCANLRRTRARQERHEMNRALLAPSTIPDPAAELSPEVAAALDDAIASLHVDDRTLILRRYFEGASPTELASAMNLSEPALRKRLSRAIDRLREHLTTAGVTVSSGAVATSLAATLPGTSMPAAALTKSVLATIASSTPTSAALATALTHGVLMTTAVKVSIAVTAAIALTAGAIYLASNPGSNAPSPQNTVTAAVAPSPSPSTGAGSSQPPTETLIERAERYARSAQYGSAMATYAEELSTLDEAEYRDKKDFEWIVKLAEQYNKPLNPIRQSAIAYLDDPSRTSELVDWRVYRLLGNIAQRQGDKQAQAKAIRLAIEHYPLYEYVDIPRYSSLQHLYNELAGIVADESGYQAGTEALLAEFRKNDQFRYIFVFPWSQRASAAKHPEWFPEFAQKVIQAYAERAESDSAHRALYDEFAAGLKAELDRFAK